MAAERGVMEHSNGTGWLLLYLLGKHVPGTGKKGGNNAHLEIPEVKSVVISKGLTYFPSLCLMSIVARIDTAAIYIYK